MAVRRLVPRWFQTLTLEYQSWFQNLPLKCNLRRYDEAAGSQKSKLSRQNTAEMRGTPF
jgi:hypothetical protein